MKREQEKSLCSLEERHIQAVEYGVMPRLYLGSMLIKE